MALKPLKCQDAAHCPDGWWEGPCLAWSSFVFVSHSKQGKEDVELMQDWASGDVVAIESEQGSESLFTAAPAIVMTLAPWATLLREAGLYQHWDRGISRFFDGCHLTFLPLVLLSSTIRVLHTLTTTL